MQLLSRSRKSLVRERGVYGQTVLDLHQQLSRIILRRTGKAEFGVLLAEPSHNRASGEIVWYSRQTGPIVAWADMSAEQQARARTDIDEAAVAIIKVAREYRNSEDRTQAADADAFFAALGYDAASDTCQIQYEKAFTVGGVPVLTEWGCDPADGSRHPVSLSNIVGVASPQADAVFPVAAAPVTAVNVVTRSPWPSWWRWLWSLMGLTLGLLLLSVLVRGCTPIGFQPRMPTLGGLFPEVSISIPQTSLDLERGLREEIADLGEQLDERALMCLAPPEEAPAELAALPEPSPDPSDEEDRLSREGGERGVVNVSLQWNNTNDLDLIVIDPLGSKIFFNNRTSASGGVLDVDMNASVQRSRQPIENVRWSNDPPSGKYQVRVSLYEVNERGGPNSSTDFTVTVTVFDERTKHRGSIANRERRQEKPVVEFSVP